MSRIFTLSCLILSILGCVAADDRSPSTTFAERVRSTPDNPMFLSDPLGRVPREIYPIDPLTYFDNVSQAMRYIESGNCEYAESLLRESIAEFQDDSSVWFFLAKCQAILGKNTEAIASYKEALSLGTTYFDTTSVDGYPPAIVLEIAKLYALSGDYNSAKDWLNEALSARYAARTQIAGLPEFEKLFESEDVLRVIGKSPDDSISREEMWKIDISYLKKQVTSLHIDPDFKTDPFELSNYLNNLASEVNSLTDKQIAARIMLFAGMLGSGHDLVLAGTPLEWIAAKAYIFSDGIFIIDSEDETLVRAQILEFGDTDANDAFETVLEAIAKDNNMSPRWTGMRLLMSPTVLQELGVIDDAESLTITVRSPNGVVRTFKPTLTDSPAITPALAPNKDNTPRYLSDMQSPIWYTVIENETVYINLNTLFDVTPGLFERVSNELSAFIDSNSIRNVVLDVRNSQGGSTTVVTPLIRALVRFDTSSFKENLYILIGRNTFSSTQNLIGKLDTLTNPVFVGEPSGGRQTFTGVFGQFQLPHSGIIIGMPTELSYSGSSTFDQRIWIAPDIPVAISSDQYFQGIDPSLDVVLDSISRE